MNYLFADTHSAAASLVTAYGFEDARGAADEMIDAWTRSTMPDADECLCDWRTIKAAIVALEAHRV